MRYALLRTASGSGSGFVGKVMTYNRLGLLVRYRPLAHYGFGSFFGFLQPCEQL